MKLEIIDICIIVCFFLVSLAIGIIVSKQSSKDSSSFYLSGRNMPWWLLGVSMVATTFAADTPNLVAGLVRADGVSGNWVWWAFLLTGMLTVFFYARLWRRSGITTDLEFYEMRYSGKSAAFLRGFRAIYLGVVFNIIIMATVCLAAIKIGHVMFGFSAGTTLVYASVVTLAYSLLGGLKGVLITDFVQFIIAMVGSIWATWYILDLPEINGMANLITHPNVQEKLDLLPDFSNTDMMMGIFIIPIAVQWWSTWYPGAEPGGGGYIAQRMLAAKDEKNATWAVLFFNLAHYALRPWPWIIIGLASLIIYPNLESLATAFPDLDSSFIKDDLSYPAMLTYLPAGLLGLVVTSLVAAFMSTISTHLNWGSSYVVNDFYARFIKQDASEKEKVIIGRLSMVAMMALAAALSFVLEEAKFAFDLIIQIGAGSGLLFILRWFWYRINPWSEITAMAVSFVIALLFFINSSEELGLENQLFGALESWHMICINVFITSIAWLVVTFLTVRSNQNTINRFHEAIFGKESKFHNFQYKTIGFLLGVIGVYSLLFATGKLLYNEIGIGLGLLFVFLVCTASIIGLRKKLF
ncbi:Na+/proline symporter [Nonlabens dokdonensis]|uniref:Sodium solute symporter n=2 Tax=Nonlabens dokdonensis TaxID=328515 RepID=L7WF15_NONDD|nr:sodium:solute symporter family protein [Nonlabens dokdonensis]AGC78541.1 sodium solute symporter [Nonlabens dokdonensis DSW-6]PZX38284.1 Na+/proline symporter [Nonlabens dokdonensis]